MKSLRTFYVLVPLLLFAGWALNYYFWRSHGGTENLRPLFDTSKQWYIGRDGEADAKTDIQRGRLKLFGGWSGNEFGPYELSSYQHILRDRYSVEPVSLYDGDAIPDQYVVPYCNAYNAVIFEHLKATYGPDIAKKIKAEYQQEAELKLKAAELQEQQQEPADSTTAAGQRIVPPEEFLGGKENLTALTRAEILTVEKVSVPPELKLKGIKDGKPEFEELPVSRWSGGPLRVEKGPVAVPPALARRIKAFLTQNWIDDGSVSPADIPPAFRLSLKEPGHVLEILVIDRGSFQLYRDSTRLGGRPPGPNDSEFRKITDELEALLQAPTTEPN